MEMARAGNPSQLNDLADQHGGRDFHVEKVGSVKGHSSTLVVAFGNR